MTQTCSECRVQLAHALPFPVCQHILHSSHRSTKRPLLVRTWLLPPHLLVSRTAERLPSAHLSGRPIACKGFLPLHMPSVATPRISALQWKDEGRSTATWLAHLVRPGRRRNTEGMLRALAAQQQWLRLPGF